MLALREAADEKLRLASEGESQRELDRAVAFGRWLQLPSVQLGRAAEKFKTARAERMRRKKLLAKQRPQSPPPESAPPPPPPQAPRRRVAAARSSCSPARQASASRL